MTKFEKETAARVAANGRNRKLGAAAGAFMAQSLAAKYSYNFSWLGRPVFQYPQDLLAMQELIFKIKPDLIIETGVARGGSLVFYASLLELNAACGGPAGGIVAGVDNALRPANRRALAAHPLRRRMRLVDGGSVSTAVLEKVRALAAGRRRVLVALDSDHSRAHVLAELEAYGPLVSRGSYCVVFDTVVEKFRRGFFPGRPWGRGDSPGAAVAEFLKADRRFRADAAMDARLLITAAPGGYLKRVR